MVPKLALHGYERWKGDDSPQICIYEWETLDFLSVLRSWQLILITQNTNIISIKHYNFECWHLEKARISLKWVYGYTKASKILSFNRLSQNMFRPHMLYIRPADSYNIVCNFFTVNKKIEIHFWQAWATELHFPWFSVELNTQTLPRRPLNYILMCEYREGCLFNAKQH